MIYIQREKEIETERQNDRYRETKKKRERDREGIRQQFSVYDTPRPQSTKKVINIKNFCALKAPLKK